MVVYNKHRSRQLLALMVTMSLAAIPLICPAEEDSEDIFASVVIEPTFKINVDKDYLDFGHVQPGESVTLKEATHYNTIKFVSNKGRKYYIKIHILGEIIGSQGIAIPPESFKWKVYQVSGEGEAVRGWQNFSKEPVMVYTSTANEEAGGENSIRFQYRLDLPAEARGGHYSLKVAYLLTEER